ncbi:MAG TPA: hypothetical protein VJS44_04740 [Pyrinomonadaceae bacterium]|nr:hypothetical protein [Pyrinomonadaceae bacterium]
MARSKYAERTNPPYWRKATRPHVCFNCDEKIRPGHDVLIFPGIRSQQSRHSGAWLGERGATTYACGECGDEELPRRREITLEEGAS